MEQYLTPSKIVAELDKYIIGQQEAKKSVAIALRNRWRRLNTPSALRQEIMPNNILMIGSTGVGKTEIARRLAQLADAPFIKVEASKFTEVGYVGRDVESMVRDLVEQSINMVKASRKAECCQKATENAQETILDILVPPIKPPGKAGFTQVSQIAAQIQASKEKNISIGLHHSIDDEEEEEYEDPENNTVIEATPLARSYEFNADVEFNERTREKYRQMLLNGELNDRKIELEIQVATQAVHISGPAGVEGLDGLQDILSNMMPRRKKKRTFTIADALEYLIEEETQKLIDMDSVAREAIEKAENTGIIFIDEIDKIAATHKSGSGPDVSREGVQRDLLPVVEGTVVNTKHGAIRTDYVLFIAAGAFHVSKPSDLIPELQGRFPIRVELNPLTREDFVQILKQPRNALTKQYQALLAAEQVELVFEEESIEEIASIAFDVNQQVENIGARRLHTIMSNLLENILFEVPDHTTTRHYTISRTFVHDKLKHIARSKDLSRFIL